MAEYNYNFGKEQAQTTDQGKQTQSTANSTWQQGGHMPGSDSKAFQGKFCDDDGNPSIPWWMVIGAFFIAAPLGVGLAAVNIFSMFARNAKSGYGTSGPTDHQGTWAGDATGRTVYVGKKSHKNSKRAGRGLATVLTVMGVIALIVGISGLPDNIQYLLYTISEQHGIAYGVGDVIESVLWIVSGAGMMLAAGRMRRVRRLRRQLVAVVGKEKVMAVGEIAAAMGMSEEKTRGHLQHCIEQGEFGPMAYLDRRTDYLVVEGQAPQPEESTKTDKSQTTASAAAEAADEYSRILNQLREVNRQIPDAEMSTKITRLESLTEKIFILAKEKPRQGVQLRRFIDYYLPTCLKLLQQYARLDAQQVEGRNISEAKRQIEDTMDTMITAFEQQLDKMFYAESVDISVDIAAMQNMMEADGLSGDGMAELGKLQ